MPTHPTLSLQGRLQGSPPRKHSGGGGGFAASPLPSSSFADAAPLRAGDLRGALAAVPDHHHHLQQQQQQQQQAIRSSPSRAESGGGGSGIDVDRFMYKNYNQKGK
jgi:hypothetical protein